MKHLLAICVLLLGAQTFAVATQRVAITPATEDVTITVLPTRSSETVLQFTVNSFAREAVTIQGQSYFAIHAGDAGQWLEAGAPSLPRLCGSVIIPDAVEVEVEVLSSEYRDYPATPVAPSKGNLLRTVDPANVPDVFGPVYQGVQPWPNALATLREPYILRDYRGIVVEVNAFQYLPATQTLRVYTSVTVAIREAGPGQTNVLVRDAAPAKVDPAFDGLYRTHFLNYGSSGGERYTPVQEDGEMLIISHGDYVAAMAPFVQWKIQKGIKTTLLNLTAIGNTSTAIQNFILSYYLSSGGNLTYVLLVGDAEQLATPMPNGEANDPIYAKVAGSDNYPDIFVGRFSAETVAQVQTQVERSIEYERDAQAGAAWYHYGTGIASNQGPGDDDEYDYQHEALIRTDLLGYTYTAVDQIYDPTASAEAVTSALNAGRGIINYTGHGSQQAWSTTGFSNSHIAALTNDNRLPFIFSVACVNGHFNGTTCFGEAWLRQTRNGQPTGALATYMSSINQSWNPPMDAQDEFVDLLRQGLKTTFGGLCINAACHMIDVYGESGVAMYDTWHIFGDPSVQVRTATPAAMTVSHAGQISSSATSYTVVVSGLPNALCALSRGTTLYGAGYTGVWGIAGIPVSGALIAGDVLTLTVTAPNKLTYVSSVVVEGAPAYDACPGKVISSLPYSHTSATTFAANNYDVGCVSGDAADVVYSLSLANCQTVTVSLCGSAYDTGLEVRSGGSCPGTAQVACNDDNASCGSESLQSELSFVAQPGVAYYILIDGYQTSTGVYTLNVSGTPFVAPNDACPGTTIASLPYSTTGNTQCAAYSYTHGLTGSSPDVVYAYTATSCQTVTVTLCGSGYDTGLDIRTGGSCPGSTLVIANDDGDCNGVYSGQSTVSFIAATGVTYYMLVYGYGMNAGAYALTVTGVPYSEPDACPGRAITALPYSNAGDTRCATNNYPHTVWGSSPDVLYALTLPTCQTVTVSLCGSGFDTGLEVRADSLCPGSRLVNHDDDYCGSWGPSQTAFVAQAGVAYWILVYGYDTAAGPYSLNVSGVPFVAPNDVCPGTAITALPFTDSGITRCAGDDYAWSCPTGGNSDGPEVMYTLTLPSCRSITATLCGSGYDTGLEVRTGGDCPGMTAVVCNDDNSCSGVVSNRSSVSFYADAGVTYYLMVDGYANDAGPFVLNVSGTACPELAVPSVVSLVNGPDLNLYWTAVPGATSYVIYRGLTPDVAPIAANCVGRSGGTSYVDIGVLGSDATRQFYAVTAEAGVNSAAHAAEAVDKSARVEPKAAFEAVYTNFASAPVLKTDAAIPGHGRNRLGPTGSVVEPERAKGPFTPVDNFYLPVYEATLPAAPAATAKP